jgi:xylulokinase
MVADILNLPVFISSSEGTKEAAALGGALLAKWVWWRSSHVGGSFEDMAKELGEGIVTIKVAEPDSEKEKFYEGLVEAYGKCEEIVLRSVESA